MTIDEIIETLQILKQYSFKGTPIFCDRGTLFLNIGPDDLSSEHKARLVQLGFEMFDDMPEHSRKHMKVQATINYSEIQHIGTKL